jgi:hypothetical protein
MSAQTTLATTREIYELVQQINAELDTVQVKGQRTDVTLSRVVITATAILGIVKRMSGGNEDVEQFITVLLRLIHVANMLRVAMIAVNAASGPPGWIFAGVGIIASIFTVTDMVGTLT